MKKVIFFTTTFLLSAAFLAYAGEPKIITLKDGSRIQGRIVGIENSRYVVESQALGEIKIPEDNVASIIAPSETAAAPTQTEGRNALANSPAPSSEQIQAVQGQIMSDPGIMAAVQELTQDPEVMAAMSDPSFVQAVQSGNTQNVQSNPHLQRLMANPKIQAIVEKLQAKQKQ